MMGVEAALEAVDSGGTTRPRLGSWGTVGAIVAIPVAYAALFNISFRIDDNPFNGPDGFMILALFGLKVLTVAALVVGLHRIGGRIAATATVAWAAAAIWALVGAVLVVGVARAKDGGASLGVDHLWPGQSDQDLLDHLEPGPGPGWDAASIVTAEVVAVVVLAAAVAATLRAGRGYEPRAVTAVTMVGFLFGLVVYDGIVGWSVLFDFDPFVGDAVLGSLTYELAFLPFPIDPLGALVLAAIGVANGLVLIAASGWTTGR